MYSVHNSNTRLYGDDGHFTRCKLTHNLVHNDITTIRSPDIHVGGLMMFYNGFFFFLSFLFAL